VQEAAATARAAPSIAALAALLSVRNVRTTARDYFWAVDVGCVIAGV